jgi:hypothetical protein
MPTLVISQITIRERIEISGAQSMISAVTTATLPTLRFEYTTCCLFNPTTLYVNSPLGLLTAQGTGGAVLSIPNAPGGLYSITLREEVGYLTNVGLEAKEKIFLDTTLMRSGTYQKVGGPGYVYWTIPPYQTPVKIKIALASNELAPLGDIDNKQNPDRSDTLRPMVIDYTNAKTTPMNVMVSYHDGTPVRNYRLTFQSFGKDTTGGHLHQTKRPGGRFWTALRETVYVMQQRTDTAGKVETRYFCSGFGGKDSINVRGTQPTDTATALVSLRIMDLEELTAGTHYELIGETDPHPRNHFGTKKTISKLKALADTAYARLAWTLRYNDISLVNGGPFDCDASHIWNTPHQNHRQGVSVDLDDVATTGSGNKVITKKKLTEWIEIIQGSDHLSFIDEGSHFHVTVK